MQTQVDSKDRAGDVIARRALMEYGQIEISVFDEGLWMRPKLALRRGQSISRRVSWQELTEDPQAVAAAAVILRYFGITRGYVVLKIKEGHCVEQEASDVLS
jgi:hypothetical protein